MRKFILGILILSTKLSAASTYYFSSSEGNDSRTSTQAKSTSTPWKSISKLNSFFYNFQPGDSILLKRGNVFYGTISVGKSGSSSNPIVISSYGEGEAPEVNGFTLITNWKSIGNGLYESYNSSYGTSVNMVTMNGEQKAKGRWPNKGYMTFESHYGKTSITDQQLSSSPDWDGGEVVIRTSHWTIERCKITSHSGTKISYTTNEGAYEPRNNYGYFVQNHIKALDQLGEWAYNSSTQKLTMYFGSNSPSSYTVKVASLDYVIRSGDKSYVTIEGITFRGAKQRVVNINGGTGMSVINCKIAFSGVDGVRGGGTNFRLENSEITDCYNDGVNCSGGTAPVIRNNMIRNTMTEAGMGQNGNGKGAGIRSALRGLVEYNRVYNSGFVGIQLSGDYTIIRNNLIDTFCFVKDDGGAIYTHNGANIAQYGRKVQGNIVLNGVGAALGTDVTFSSADGIYMDDNSNGVEISGNTIAHSNRGIYIHNSRNIEITNNTGFNNINGQLHMKHDNLGSAIRNVSVFSNIFFSKYPKDPTSVVNTKDGNSDISSMGRFDSNYYARPINNTGLILTTTYYNTSSQIRKFRDLPDWKNSYSEDPQAKLTARNIAANPEDSIKFFYNPTRDSVKIDLDGIYMDAPGNKFEKEVVLSPYSSKVLTLDTTSIIITDTLDSNTGDTTTADTTKYTSSIHITSPVQGGTYTSGKSLLIEADAPDPAIENMYYYVNGALIHTELSAPWSWPWYPKTGTYNIVLKAGDKDGKIIGIDSVSITVKSSTSGRPIQQEITDSVFSKIYPIPATTTLYTTFDIEETVYILNILGNVVKTFDPGTARQLDISSLPAGSYILTMGEVRKKFIKQ